MEEEFDVPGPHEEAVEHATKKGGMAQRIALMTAILATVGALISYKSGSNQNEAMFLKNQSILKQTEASDKWAYYQAKSVKAYIDDAAASLSTDAAVKARFTADKARQESERKQVQAEAMALEKESHALGEESDAKLRPHEKLALALTLVQIAIALAAITVLTQSRWLLWASRGTAVAGIAVSVAAFL